MKISDSELQRAIDHLEAGDWRSAHEIVQQDEESQLACGAHGIVHMMEGDEANSLYWFRKARRPFPERASISEEISALKSAAEPRLEKRRRATFPRRLTAGKW
jgi:hypothetical protein